MRVATLRVVERDRYEMRLQVHEDAPGSKPLWFAYAKNGLYLGDEETARLFTGDGWQMGRRVYFLPLPIVGPRFVRVPMPRRQLGMTVFQSSGGGTVANVGYSPRTRTWWGWSHRAMCGFQPGSVVEKGDVLDGPVERGFRAESYGDASMMARMFAELVG